MSDAGSEHHGIECQKCREPVLLSLATGKITEKEIAELGDPFTAKCPGCNHEAEYSQSAIGMIVATGSD